VVPDILFLQVPDDKVGFNRLHLDLRPTGASPDQAADQAAEVARLEALGATRVDVGQGEVSWVVMADPEGNEFCVLSAYPPEVQAQWQASYDGYVPATE
jgi:hypothetical protein